MFKTSRISDYICTSCELVKPREIIVHVEGKLGNILFVICSDCLEELKTKTLPEEANWIDAGNIKWKPFYEEYYNLPGTR